MEFFRFSPRMEGGATENILYIDGYMESERPWYDESGRVCAPENFRDALNNLPEGPLTVYINSSGGSVDCGVAIYSLLRQSKRKTTALVTGVAYSSATLPLCGCDEVYLSPAAMLMIHNPAADVGVWPDVAGHQKAIDYLTKVKAAVLEAYVEHTGRKPEEISADMDAATFMTAKEAIAKGWANGIMSAPQTATMNSRISTEAMRGCMAAGKRIAGMTQNADEDRERAEIAKYAQDCVAAFDGIAH